MFWLISVSIYICISIYKYNSVQDVSLQSTTDVHDSSLLLFFYCVQGVLAAKYPHVSQSMQSIASQLQQVQEEEEQTEVGITKE